MNILFICDEYPPGQIGGIGTAVQTLGRELVKQGHRVVVAGLYPYSYGQKNYEEDHGIKVWRLRYGLKLPLKNNSRVYNAIDKLPDGIKHRLNGKRAFSKFIRFLNKTIADEKIDLIEIADYNNFCQHIGFVATWPSFNVPLVLKSHGSHTYFCRELGVPPTGYLYQTDVALYKRADAFSAVSRYTAEEDKKIFGVSREIEVLYNGIPIPEDSAREVRDLRTVVFTGSLAPKKGILSLMKAWNKVFEKFPDARLVIMGKGKTKHLSALLSEGALASVEFKGHVGRSTLFNQLSKATLAIFPSYSETFGLGVVEAMTVHCPVIYTKRSCGPEIVRDRIDGLLVDPDNIEEISDTIIAMIDDKDMRDRLADSGFRSATQRFDIKHIASRHLEFYSGVINQFKTHAVDK